PRSGCAPRRALSPQPCSAPSYVRVTPLVTASHREARLGVSMTQPTMSVPRVSYGRSRARIRSGLPDRGWWRSFLGTPRHTSYRRVASKLVFSRVAVLPQPPLLVPELMGMSTAGSRPLRAACLDAVRRLTAVSGDWVVLAPGRRRES